MRAVHFKQKSFMSFQFVLLVGAFHHCEEACIRELRKELVASVLPCTPDAICITAPTNNLTASQTVEEAGVDFVP